MRGSRALHVGSLPLGGGAPVSVQSMTNTDTRNAGATLAQVRALAAAGADLVRISVYDDACLEPFQAVVRQSPVPIVADIHYRADLAVGALERGAAKVRINPGNIGSEQKVRLVADCARAHHAPIRIGVNSGSLEKDILQAEGGVTARGMLNSALRHARLLEAAGFTDIVLSLKATDVPLTVAAYRLAAAQTDYPLHVGVTEAGLPGEGHIKSAVGIGSLLLDGIGDTVRVSLTGDPVPEVGAALDILRACGLRRDGVNVISCPTCGRTSIDVTAIARRVKEALAGVRVPLTVAVMGCVVNGPGEAREADIGLAGGGLAEGQAAGGEGGTYAVGAIFERGKPPERVEGDLAALLIERALRLIRQKDPTAAPEPNRR
ncbi:MAG: flavodoxin-dependent (E)-4-hydroxy-3-methylbut-2-enyl-diphosphate synthase [Candidatus Limiplasma sp.]|nr:flavodoxin-dependent (E)-4-hydroxy-3-methylbut-2-enyl-diphosphate synthase [Candidatus Limiplasma sp.]